MTLLIPYSHIEVSDNSSPLDNEKKCSAESSKVKMGVCIIKVLVERFVMFVEIVQASCTFRYYCYYGRVCTVVAVVVSVTVAGGGIAVAVVGASFVFLQAPVDAPGMVFVQIETTDKTGCFTGVLVMSNGAITMVQVATGDVNGRIAAPDTICDDGQFPDAIGSTTGRVSENIDDKTSVSTPLSDDAMTDGVILTVGLSPTHNFDASLNMMSCHARQPDYADPGSVLSSNGQIRYAYSSDTESPVFEEHCVYAKLGENSVLGMRDSMPESNHEDVIANSVVGQMMMPVGNDVITDKAQALFTGAIADHMAVHQVDSQGREGGEELLQALVEPEKTPGSFTIAMPVDGMIEDVMCGGVILSENVNGTMSALSLHIPIQPCEFLDTALAIAGDAITFAKQMNRCEQGHVFLSMKSV